MVLRMTGAVRCRCCSACLLLAPTQEARRTVRIGSQQEFNGEGMCCPQRGRRGRDTFPGNVEEFNGKVPVNQRAGH